MYLVDYLETEHFQVTYKMNFKKLFEVTDDDKIKLGDEMKTLLNTELCLGMTRYVCRYGTLGEGFEKLTDSQRYYQSLKEIYTRAMEMRRSKANAKKAYADYLEAAEEISKAQNEIERLRAQAKFELAETAAFELLVHAEDTLRQLDEFNKVRLELQDKVRAEFPQGIEQAEHENWSAVMKYRIFKAVNPGNGPQSLDAVPLPMIDKFKIGQELKRSDLTAPLAISKEITHKIEG